MSARATTTEPELHWSIGDVEPLLHDLEAQAGILGHVANSNNTIEPDQLILIEDQLISLHKQLMEIWRAAWDEWVAGKDKAEAALVAVQAARDEYGVPGSKADIRHAEALWRLLAAAAGGITEQYEERNEGRAAADAKPVATMKTIPPAEPADAELIALCDKLIDNEGRLAALINSRNTTEDEERTEAQLMALYEERREIVGEIEDAPRARTDRGRDALARTAWAIAERDSDGNVTHRTKGAALAWMLVEALVGSGRAEVSS